MKTILILISTVALLSTPAADPLVNGGFEQPSLSPWTGTGGARTIAGTPFEGNQAARLTFDSTGNPGSVTLSQSFSTSTADFYTFRFAAQRYETFGGQDDVSLTFGARIDSSPIATTLPTFAGGGFQPGSWETFESTVSLPAGNHVLEFAATRDSSLFGRNVTFLIDGASVTAVPEPSSYALLITGAALILHRTRQKRRI